MTRRVPTAEMTVGPFFPRDFSPAGAADLSVLAGKRAKGEVIEVFGRVTQDGGMALDNVVIELWQADASGIYCDPSDLRHAECDPGFLGWGRTATNAQGDYAFKTIMPGARDGRAPHINLLVLFSGLMHQLSTAIYFADAPADAVFAAVPKERRGLLIAKQEAPGRYRFDIRLRGEGETPFFAHD